MLSLIYDCLELPEAYSVLVFFEVAVEVDNFFLLAIFASTLVTKTPPINNNVRYSSFFTTLPPNLKSQSQSKIYNYNYYILKRYKSILVLEEEFYTMN